jgi:hypothetical protein
MIMLSRAGAAGRRRAARDIRILPEIRARSTGTEATVSELRLAVIGDSTAATVVPARLAVAHGNG